MKAFVALIVMSMAVPAVAGDSKPADSQAQPGAETSKKARKICKREATSTGLHGSRRVCLTAAEWKERNGNSDSMIDTRSKQASY